MAALVPADIPPPDVDLLAKAAPSFAAEVAEEVEAAPVSDPEAAAPLDVFSDEAEEPVCDEDISELAEEALGGNVDVAAADAADADEGEFEFAMVDVARVVFANELIFDFNEASALSGIDIVLAKAPGGIEKASLMVVNKAAMLEAPTSVWKVKGCEREIGKLGEDMITMWCGMKR